MAPYTCCAFIGYSRRGKAAEDDSKRVLTIREKKYGLRHPETIETAKALAELAQIKP